MNHKLIIFLLIFSFVLGFSAWQSYKLDQKFSKQNFVSSTGTLLKEVPAGVSFKTFDEGETYNIDSESFSVVHFWATWCAPCEAEFPDLIELTHMLKTHKNINFLLVAVNDDAKEMRKFLSKFDLNLDTIHILVDSEDIHKKFGTYKMPESFLIGPKGVVVRKFTGQQKWNSQEFESYFKSL